MPCTCLLFWRKHIWTTPYSNLDISKKFLFTFNIFCIFFCDFGVFFSFFYPIPLLALKLNKQEVILNLLFCLKQSIMGIRVETENVLIQANCWVQKASFTQWAILTEFWKGYLKYGDKRYIWKGFQFLCQSPTPDTCAYTNYAKLPGCGCHPKAHLALNVYWFLFPHLNPESLRAEY